MNNDSLGRLVSVELRNVWASEASDFTPWLAKPENLQLLAATLGLQLELEAQEKEVGPFRADILCKNLRDDSWVLIENQLERTDHTHLGQLLTYASGLKAVTIVWVARKFTEEHRATLDWLNEITDESFNFIGVEVELWQIADSPVAPKFNIVSKPNDWSKTVHEAARRIDQSELSPTRRLQLEFWTELHGRLTERNGVIRPQKPLPQSFATYAMGRSNLYLTARLNTWDGVISVGQVCAGNDGHAHMALLLRDRSAIDQALGSTPRWKLATKEGLILLEREADFENREQWPALQSWLIEKLELFHRVFADRIKRLDAEEATPEDMERLEQREGKDL